MQTIKAIKTQLAQGEVSKDWLTELAQDQRQGVQNLLKQYNHKQAKIKSQKLAFEKRCRYEKELGTTYQYIAGIDEVGRGPLAGPVVTAAVILPADFNLYQVNDSKQLSATLRHELYAEILANAVSVGIGIADNQMIDQENIYHATELAMAQAVNNLQQKPDYLLVDAMTVPVDMPQLKLIKGDANSVSIAAASIVAKVIRDQLMINYAEIYPGYDFENNMGYGTKKHLAGLTELGVTPIHRRSFEPVKSLVTAAESVIL